MQMKMEVTRLFDLLDRYKAELPKVKEVNKEVALAHNINGEWITYSIDDYIENAKGAQRIVGDSWMNHRNHSQRIYESCFCRIDKISSFNAWILLGLYSIN